MKFTSVLAAVVLAAPAFAAPATLSKRNSYIEKLDDHSAVYQGQWVNNVGYGKGTFENSLSITGPQPNGLIEFQAGQEGASAYDIKVWATRASNRGSFTIYCDHTLIGTGNQYAAGAETNSQVVYTKTGVSCPSGIFRVKNDKGAAYMSVDALEVSYTRFTAN